MRNPEEYYAQNIKSYTSKSQELVKKGRNISFARIICALGVIAAVYFAISTGEEMFWFIAVPLFILFFILVKISVKIKEEKRFIDELIEINQIEKRVLHGDHSSISDGEEFHEAGHPYAYDLDIFGKASIFQLVNRTSTAQGKIALANMLRDPEMDPSHIRSNQKAIEELSDKADWRQQFQAKGNILQEKPEDKSEIEKWLSLDMKFAGSKVYFILGIALPVICISIWLLYAFGVVPGQVPAYCSLLLLAVTSTNLKYINRRHSFLSERLNTLSKYYQLINLIEKEHFTSDKLIAMQKAMSEKGQTPSEAFGKLIKMIDKLDNRNNIFVGIVLNGVLLWDINLMLRIEKWSQDFRAIFPIWVETVAEFDALSGLSNFRYNNTEYTLPEIVDKDEFLLDMKAGGHPWLPKKERVTNDLYQMGNPHLFIVTGANMAGKSTFLRTVGVNMVLAMLGTTVCADKFVFTPVKIYTSMRTNDSLEEHTSFFYAELKRLQFIMNKLRSGEKIYIMLDEILKGTNSKDQHTGSANLIESILNHHGVGMIATHDVELTNLKEKHPENIRNIAFEIEMESGEMVFDYKYKEGVCKNMNATMLMEKMEIF